MAAGFGIGLGVVFQNKQRSLSQSIKAKLLFLWTGNFSGDNLLSDLDSTVITVNSKDFSTSYIPATSAATFNGAASFNTPDTDEIWYRSNDVMRNTTVTELISYDFSKTFVKYDNAAPHHIRAIAILKSGETLTTNEENQIRDFFDLSIWWSGTLSSRGNLKENRFSARSVFTPDAVYPSILDDGNTMIWYDFAQGITKDGSERVSQWNDLSGNSRHLLQAADANKPIYTSSGIQFDGSNDFLKTDAFTWNNPQEIYIVFKFITWTNGDVLFDGNTTGIGGVRQNTSTPQFSIFHSSGYITGTEITGLALNTFGILRVKMKTDQSKIRLNSTTEKTGSWVTTNMGGFTLARRGANNDSYGNIVVKEVIGRKIEDTAGNDTEIMNYLKNKYSL